MPEPTTPPEGSDGENRSEPPAEDDGYFWDDLLTQDMAWSPARKAMRDAARRRESEEASPGPESRD
ncbi:hypothetical protein MalM25_19860 [Planctomycetes bacterium MalM25]|nr:hypothetical protein MalM25_19860 [Planctomycetes bacterium MalM25]